MNASSEQLSQFKPISKDFEFRHFPFYWIVRLGNRYSHKLEVALKKVNINITTWRVGMILRENGALSISEIATHAVSRLPTITKTVYKMQEQGLASIKPHEKDGRVSMVTITELGLERVESVLANTTRVFDRAFEGMSEKQLNVLNDSLQQVFDNLEDD